MKQKIKNFLNKKENIFFIILFILITIICYFFPYKSDDWSWGSNIGLERMYNLFKDYNGRYAGNILVIILARYRLLRAFIISITISLLYYTMVKLTSSKFKYIIALLMLLIPTAIREQSITWVSGFSNYVIPVLISLIYIYLNKNIFKNKKVIINKKYTIPLFFLGLITSLFVEHMTIYNLLLATFIVFITYKKDKHINIQNLLYLIGSIIGAILMFTNSCYSNILNSTDTYRTIESIHILQKISDAYFNQIYIYYIHNHTLINILICISTLCISFNQYKKHKKNTIIPSIIISIYFIYIIITQIFKIEIINNLNYKKAIEGLLVIEYLISIFSIYSTIDNKETKRKILFYLISSILIVLPLTIVSPISYRCFFSTYIFLILIVIETFNILIKEIKYQRLFQIAIILATFYHIFNYGNLYIMEYNREEYIKNHLDNTGLILPYLPNENEMNNESELNKKRLNNFREFYQIDKNINIKFISYDKWSKTNYKEDK